MSDTIIHVRRMQSHGGDGWRATETTADCSRFVCDRGWWSTLDEAIPDLRQLIEDGHQLELHATSTELHQARTIHQERTAA